MPSTRAVVSGVPDRPVAHTLVTAPAWRDEHAHYTALIGDHRSDSHLLRQLGLVPNILEMLDSTTDKTVLDAGCGNGWLSGHVTDARVLAQGDLVAPSPTAGRGLTVQMDVGELPFTDATFDVVISSLVLMWVADLRAALSEAYRVTSAGGSFVIAITHPYFYHVGDVQDDGSYLIRIPLWRNIARADVKVSDRVGPFEYFYRRLDDYFNEILGAGWRIVEYRDWFIPRERYEAAAGQLVMKLRRSSHVPTFAFFKLEKPR